MLPDSPELRRWEVPALDAPRGGGADTEPEEPLPQPPSLEEIEAIQRAAHEEGYAAGHAEGLAQAQAEMRRLQARLEGILDAFSRPLSELEGEVERALSELAARIAGALVRHAYAVEPALIAKLTREALASLGEKPRSVEVRLHPEDLEAVEPLLPAASGVRVIADPALARGDLRVHAEDVRLDARLSTRLEQILPRLLSEPSGGDEETRA
ncbi:FliH/SctL family protein [Aquimonas voraii]